MPGMDLELLSGGDMGDMGDMGAGPYGWGAPAPWNRPAPAPRWGHPYHPMHHHHHGYGYPPRFMGYNPQLAMMGAPSWFNYMAGADDGGGPPPMPAPHHHHMHPAADGFGGHIPLAMVQPAVPGVSQRGGRVQPLGFTPGVFSVDSGTTLQVTATPQRPIRGGRLVGSYSRIGTTATGLLILNSLFVGTDGQLLSADGIGFDMLSPNSFGVGVNFTPASVGNQIVATIGISNAPAAEDSVPFSLGLWGLTVG